MANPCGLSYEKTLEIIKTKVMGANYNGRDEVMQGLLADGFTYSEAEEVTNAYYKIYRKVASKTKTGLTPLVLLSAEQRRERQMNNMGVAYLNGEIASFPMTRADQDNLQKLYEKVDKADTPTLKAKFNEEASVFVQKFLPNYSNELFKSSVYARPLLSAVFFIKSMTSNLHAQIERYISNTLWDGNKMDFNKLGKFDNLANAAFLNVMKGGVPATSLYQKESDTNYRGRLEEYDLSGTGIEGNRYFQVMKFYTKWSNRFNAAPDTKGIYSNAERHMYQLLKEKYRQAGNTDEKATQLALEDMELDDVNTSMQIAEAKFNELGLDAYKNGKPTPEFKVAVAEYQRLQRDEHLWSKALDLSKDDFWKKNMLIKTELGFGDYGLFGLKAQALSGLRDKLEAKSKNKLTAAFNLYAFGFLNGASNFAEDALERMPLYGAVKVAFLQARRKNVTDAELINDIQRRQKDLIVKNVLTATFFVAAKMAESLLCPEKKDKSSSIAISEGRTQIGICGKPILVPPQMMAIYKVYSIIWQATKNEEEFFDTALNVFPVLIQSNEIGLGGSIDKIGAATAAYATAKSQGNDVRAKEELYKGIKASVDGGVSVGNSFLPLPSRLLSEAGTIIQKAEGIKQQQQKLPFAVDESGKELGFFKTAGKVTIASLGNVTGISEIMIAAMGSNKNYAVDWQGRKVAQFRGSDITGSGIEYNANDDILATAGVKAPYVNRMEKIKVDSEKSYKSVLDQRIKIIKEEDRYMTDKEYFEVSVALGNFNKKYFEESQDKLIEAIKSDKKMAKKVLLSVFDHAKKAGIEAIEKGYTGEESIEAYIKQHWKTGKPLSITKKSTD